MAVSYAGSGAPVLRIDVPLSAVGERPQALLGSVTVDGLTYVLRPDGDLALISVAPGAAETASGASDDALAIPSAVSYGGADYSVAGIGAYAFSLIDIERVMLPPSIRDVDELAFRSTAVQRVEVSEGSESYASFDGVLYDASLTCLLLIPGGRQGAVRIIDNAEVVEASVFSHCAGVDAISVDAGGTHFASWDGLLYSSDGSVLLRVPAGATEVAIREGCASIAPGAIEGCAALERIASPSTLVVISPYVLEQQPQTACSAVTAEGARLEAADVGEGEGTAAPQLSTLVAIGSASGGLPELDAAAITVEVAPGGDRTIWAEAGFALEGLGEEPEGPVAASLASFDEDASPGVAGSAQLAASNAASKLWRLTVRPAGSGYLKSTSFCFESGETSPSVQYSERTVSGGSSTVYAYGYSGGTYRWNDSGNYYENGQAIAYPGYTYRGWSGTTSGTPTSTFARSWSSGTVAQYAVFTPNTYTVSFNANGGTGGQTASVTATYNAAMPTITTTKPTRTGYTFQGWYDTSASTGGTQYYTAAGASARTWNKVGNATLYARWSINSYLVTFDAKGGSGGTTQKYVNHGSNVGTVTVPTLSGWKFSGYTDDLGTSTYLFATSAGAPTTRTITTNRTLLANWTKTVTLSPNGGTAGALASLTAGIGRPLGQKCNQVESTHSDYPIRSLFSKGITDSANWAPTRTGYTFAGYWSTSATSGGTCYISAAGVAQGTVASTFPSTLYARWTAVPYTVSFNANGGSGGQTASVTATYGLAMPTITSTAPVRAGYWFAGWYDTSASTGGTQYYTGGGASARAWDKTASTTLYARWMQNLTWNLYVNDVEAGYINSTSYKFSGGGTDPNVKYQERVVSGGSPTLTATGSSAGAYRWSDAKGLYEEGVIVANPGYAFKGWSTTADGTVSSTFSKSWDQGPCIQYAILQPKTYSVSFNANGGTGGQSTAITATYGQDMPKLTGSWRPARSGYYFAGWYDTSASTGGTQYYAADGTSTHAWDKVGNATLYARWEVTPSWLLRLNDEDAGYFHSISYKFSSGGTDPNVKYTSRGVYGGTWPITAHGGADASYRWADSAGLFEEGEVVANPGYSFKGWGASATGAFASSFMETWSAGPLAQYAILQPDSFIVSFDANGGTGGPSSSVTAVFASAMPALPGSAPTREGYTFIGWYDTPEDSGGTAYYTMAGASARSWDKPENATLYARWVPNDYAIVLDANGGALPEGQPARVAATYDADVTLPTPTRYGYAFTGWDTTREGGGDSYGAGLNVRPNMTAAPGEEVTLYAQWMLITNVELPVSAAAGATFELGVPEGTIRVAGTAEDPQAFAPGWLRSKMPVPVRMESVACVGAPAPSPGSDDAAVFWAEHAPFADLTMGPAEGGTLVAAGALALATGDVVSKEDLPSWLVIPAATSAEAMGELKLLYGLSLDRLFADPAEGGAGVEIADLLPEGATSSFGLPNRLMDVVFTVDVTQYA